MSKGNDMNLGEPMRSPNKVEAKPMNGKEQQIAYWQSDYSIVSEKSMKVEREKAVANIQRDRRDTSSIHSDGAKMTTKLLSITQRAKENPRYRFMTLKYLLNEDFLKDCFCVLKRDKATGIDGETYKEYEVKVEERLKDLVGRMKTNQYRPKPVRRVYIPKGNGELRPLGIPTVEDKIIQMGIKKIFEAIFENDFEDVSYGFRPNRSSHNALEKVDRIIMTKPINYVVDMDIRKFFDTVDHKIMMRLLKQRIADPKLLQLIMKFLKAGVMEEGKYKDTDRGTPQGGILSPILANIYLHYVIDVWFEREIKKELKGYAEIVRYADDFVICFQAEYEANKVSKELKEQISKYGLSISEEKSRIIEFGRYVWEKAKRKGIKVGTFDFLGFTHYCDKTIRGKFKLGRKTAEKKFRQKIVAMNEWLKDIRNAIRIKEWWKTLKAKLIGHYRYYGISGNMRAIKRYYILTSKLVYKWINSRSQEISYTYAQYCKFVRYNPLPKPKIYRNMYVLTGS
jgi:group II intron reverse transcriptase/maturase